MPQDSPFPSHVPVLIAGGGPVGLTLAALLARQGIASLVIEADQGYCSGSRAICVSRRSQEVLSWAGAAQALVGKGLPWTGGRSYWRDTEVLHFEMPSQPSQRFADGEHPAVLRRGIRSQGDARLAGSGPRALGQPGRGRPR